jgi:pyrimidine deaminase RibD-like protein
LINVGVKHVIYAATDPDASESTKRRFNKAKVTIRQVANQIIVGRAIELFNSTCTSADGHLPLK